MTSLISIILVNLGNILGAIGALFFKLGADKMKLRYSYKNKRLIFGGIIYVSSAVLFILALRGGQLTILYPMVAVVYIWVSLLSMWILKEQMNWYKWIGVLFILLGVSFVGIA